MQLRNEIKHLLYLNVLTLSFLLCFDCAYLTCLLLRSWAQAVACPKGVIGDTQACFGGASAKFPIHPTWLINRLSHWLLRAQLDFPNSPGTDSYPFVSYYSGGAPSEGFATLRNVPKLSNFVRSCSGVESQRRCQHLTNGFGGIGTLGID